MPQLVWSATAEGRRDYLNARWHEFTGATPETDPERWAEFLHPDDRDAAYGCWSNAVASGRPFEAEYRVRRAADGQYRWFLDRGQAMHDDGGRIIRWFGTCTDIDEHRRREGVLAFLADAGRALAASLEFETTLAAVARLAVPRLADWCAIDMLGPDGQLRRLAVEHVEPEKAALARELFERYPPRPDDEHGVPLVLRTGRPELVPDISDGLLVASAVDGEQLRIARELRLRSYVVVPLTVQGSTVGAITLVSAEGMRRFGEEELSTAMELARRASLAIENAQLYEETVRGQERLEQQAAELELQNEQLQEQSVELEMQAAQLQEQAVELSASNDALQDSVSRLRMSEQRLSLAFEAAALGWWDWDTREEVVHWSPQLERIFGYGPGEFDGSLARYRGHLHPEDGTQLQDAVQRALDGDQAGYHVRHRIRRVDGEQRWLDGYGRVVRGAEGERRILGVVLDVTDGVRAEQERSALLQRERAARREAETANRAKAEFLATMSHELRTPLNAIAGYTDLLTLGVRGEVNDDQREDLRRIKKSAQHLLGLINDILNFARLEAGQVELRIAPLSAADTVAGVEALVAPQVREKKIRYLAEVRDPSLVAVGDAEKVQQVLLNLLTNAVKFTEPGGRIRVTCGPDADGMVCIEVEDSGRGIPADKLETIFEPFVQVDRHLTQESQQGVGLGLAISRDLARAMGGDLTAASEPGRGSRFRLTLPSGG